MPKYKETKMASKKILLGMLAVVLVISAVFTGCATISKENEGTFPVIGIPAKDFEILGLIFTENVVENGGGQVFTYYELLKQAKELGGNSIINVTIDVKRQGMGFLGLTFNSKETWYGSAIAIKYLPGTLKDVNMSEISSGGSSGKNPLSPSSWFK
jgi:hypothetical protein